MDDTQKQGAFVQLKEREAHGFCGAMLRAWWGKSKKGRGWEKKRTKRQGKKKQRNERRKRSQSKRTR